MVKTILKEFAEFNEKADSVDIEKFKSDVQDSFVRAKTPMHYICVMPISTKSYMDSCQQTNILKYGYIRDGRDDRFNHIFYATISVCQDIENALKKEGFILDTLDTQDGTIYVYTLFGKDKSHFDEDYKQMTQKQSMYDEYYNERFAKY